MSGWGRSPIPRIPGSLSLFPPLALSMSRLCVCPLVSICVSVCVSVCVCLSVCLSACLGLCLCLRVSVCVSVCVSLSVCLFVCPRVSVCLSPLSVSRSACLSLCLGLYIHPLTMAALITISNISLSPYPILCFNAYRNILTKRITCCNLDNKATRRQLKHFQSTVILYTTPLLNPAPPFPRVPLASLVFTSFQNGEAVETDVSCFILRPRERVPPQQLFLWSGRGVAFFFLSLLSIKEGIS